MGPTGAAVLGNVLIPHVSQVVDTTDVAPVPGIGELAGLDVDQRTVHLVIVHITHCGVAVSQQQAGRGWRPTLLLGS